nr:hypothetical protein [Tanacetum cinerariifolium]
MPALEDVDTFDFSNKDKDDDEVVDMNNLDTTIQVSPTPTTRIHKDHPLDQVIEDLQSTTQTRNMTKNLEEHGFKRAIGTKWIFKNKKDERGIMIRNKARLVTQGHTQEEEIDYDEVFAPVARIEAIRKELFNAFERLMHAIFQMSCMGELTFFLGLQVKQKNDGIFISQDKYVTKILKKFRFTEVKNVCTPMETQKHLLKDEDGKEVDVHMYRYQVNPKISHLYAEKRIFSDYAEASLDRKSTTRGCWELLI